VIERRVEVDFAQSIRSLGRALTMPSLIVLFAEYAFMGVGVWSAITWLPYYFNETFGMDLAWAALFGTLFFKGGSVLGVLAGGVPSDYVAKKHIGARMTLFGIFYLLAAPFMLVFLVHPTAWMVAGAIFCFGFVQAAGQINSNPLVCELLPPEARSTGIGLTNMLACLAGGMGVMVAGAMKAKLGLAGVFASITVVTALCGGMLMFAAMRWVRRDADSIGTNAPGLAQAVN
jgi:sugar phosphate permease